MNQLEARAAAEELYLAFNGGKPVETNAVARGLISREDHHIHILAGSLMFQMEQTAPDLKVVRRIWDGLLEAKGNRKLDPWLRKYARPMVLMFRELGATRG